MQHLKWDYSEHAGSHYLVDIPDNLIVLRLESLSIDAPQTPENDADVQIIEDALSRIAERIK